MASPERTSLPSGPPRAPVRQRGPQQSVIPQRRTSQTPPPEEITQRTLVSAVVLTAIVTAIICALVFAVVLDKGVEGSRGASGPAGETGDRGERGARGRTNRDVSAAAVAKAIQADPGAIGAALDATELGAGSTATDSLNDSTTDTTQLEDDLEGVRDDLSRICDAVRSSQSSPETTDLPC